MPRCNLGRTGLAGRRRGGCPMAAYDACPPPLRAWLAGAALPWSVRSARRIFARALSETGSEAAALARLAAVERGTLARARRDGPLSG